LVACPELTIPWRRPITSQSRLLTGDAGCARCHVLPLFTEPGWNLHTPDSVSAGATKTLTVTADVGLFYRCNIHPTQMQGKIDFK